MNHAYSADIALNISDLTKHFGGPFFNKKKILAVDQISFKIKRGEIYGLLGPNGAGKTTTIKMLCGLIKPDSGEITINNVLLNKNRCQSLSAISTVLEGKRNIYWRLTVKENLEYFGNIRGKTTQQISERIDYLLELLDLTDKKNTISQKLSRGMQQKVAVCNALVTDPDILLLDEPTLGLDVRSAKLIENCLLEIARKQGKTILLTTHNMNLAQNLCDRLSIIHQGSIIQTDSVSNLLKSSMLSYFEFKLTGEVTSIFETQLKILDFDTRISKNAEHFTIKAYIQNNEEIFQMMSFLKTQDSKIESINKKEPTLEEVFLHHTQ